MHQCFGVAVLSKMTEQLYVEQTIALPVVPQLPIQTPSGMFVVDDADLHSVIAPEPLSQTNLFKTVGLTLSFARSELPPAAATLLPFGIRVGALPSSVTELLPTTLVPVHFVTVFAVPDPVIVPPLPVAAICKLPAERVRVTPEPAVMTSSVTSACQFVALAGST